jgi:hypothetical protein
VEGGRCCQHSSFLQHSKCLKQLLSFNEQMAGTVICAVQEQHAC